MRKLDLQLFVGGHSVTVVADGGMSAASASATSDVAKDTTVTLTLTPATNKELASVEVLSGGVTLEVSAQGVYSFAMGEADVVIVVKSKANNLYRVTEQCTVWINDAKTVLNKNVEVVLTKQGGIADVKATPAAITVNDCVQALIDQGILVKV